MGFGSWALTALVLAVLSPRVCGAQFSLKAGLAGGTGTDDWGTAWGYHLGIDEQNETRGRGKWSMTLDLSRLITRLADDDAFSRVYLEAGPSDTTWFANDFSATTVTLGGRYEPRRARLGFSQTVERIISPFVGFHAGYRRLDHGQSSTRQISGVHTSHGIPVGVTLGARVGWGGRPERSLEEEPLINYLGFEVALDLTTTIWMRNRRIVTADSGVLTAQSAPKWPMVALWLAFMYHRSEVYGGG